MVAVPIGIPPALPQIGSDLSVSLSSLQWVVNAYLLSQVALVVVGGSLGDRFGHKLLYCGGMSGFAVSLCLCAAAPSGAVLILAAALAGALSALALGNALALIVDAFPGTRRKSALGLWGVSLAGTYALAPLICGAIAEQYGWRWLFLFLAIVAGWGVVTALRITDTHEKAVAATDWLGSGLLALGLALFTGVLIEGNSRGWMSVEIGAGVVLAVAFFVGFGLRERSASSPLLDPALLRNPTTRAIGAATLVTSMGFFALTFYLPIDFRARFDSSPSLTATMMVGATGAAFLAALASFRLAGRLRQERQIVGALLALAAGFGATALIGRQTYALMLPGLVLIGCGIGAINAPIASLAGQVGGRFQGGVVQAMVYLCRPTGAAVGIAAFGALLQTAVSARIDLPRNVDRAAVVGSLAGGEFDRAARVIPTPLDGEFLASAPQVFADGMQLVFLCFSALALGTAVFAAYSFRSRLKRTG